MSPSSYRNMIFNQSAHIVSQDCFLNNNDNDTNTCNGNSNDNDNDLFK